MNSVNQHFQTLGQQPGIEKKKIICSQIPQHQLISDLDHLKRAAQCWGDLMRRSLLIQQRHANKSEVFCYK